VLGAAGFSGRHFVAFARASGWARAHRLVLVARSFPEAGPGFACEALDLADTGALERILLTHRPDWILSLAGRHAPAPLARLYDDNVRLPVTLLDAAARLLPALAKIVLVGSAAEYGRPERLPVGENAPLRPVTAYGLSKKMQSEAALFAWRALGVPVVVARTFNLTGEGAPEAVAPGAFARQIAEAPDGGTIVTGDLDARRDFVTVERAVAAYATLLERGAPGEVYNVCSGRPERVGDLLERMIRASGKRLCVRVDSARVRPGEPDAIWGDASRLAALEAGA
jgi:GDP-4-dehydro-6-deoxy-D-mannose reductase